MARRNPTANSIQTNGDVPPPSTLAAQIVQNQDRQPAPQPNGQTTTFAGLLHEILHNHAATPETDVNVNVKLVNVVAEAGLGPLTDCNPFAQWDVLIQQATDSIAVIEATIKRQPEALFTPVKQDGPQLLLPLLARLLAVCGRAKCDDLPIIPLFDAVTQALENSIDLWPHAQIVRQVTEDCVEETLSRLSSVTEQKPDTALRLPPAKSVAMLWPESENAVALPSGSQMTLRDTAHAFVLCLQLSGSSAISAARQLDFQVRLQRLTPQIRPQLETSAQWDTSLERLLGLPVNILTLAAVLQDTKKALPSTTIQVVVAKSLITALRCDGMRVRDNLLPMLLSAASEDTFDSLQEDLKIAVTTVICRYCNDDDRPTRVTALSDAFRQDNVMTDSDLLAAFKELSLAPLGRADYPRKRKRRRIHEDESGTGPILSKRRASKLLGGAESEDLTGLHKVASNVYLSLNEEMQCSAWQTLTDLASVEPQVALQTVSALIELPQLQQSKRPRVLSTLAIGACAGITKEAAYLDMARSSFGQLVLRSLHSSLRELRIAAGQCLAPFLRNDLPGELKLTNRKVALEYLRVLSERDVTNEQETLIGAWGAVAVVCDDSELNLALLQLVEYLGHPNPFICGLAFSELESVASRKGMTVNELCKPFWASIAASVVQDLSTRPQKAQQLCDVLGTQLNSWLVETQRYTVPTLVLNKKRDILQRIAAARGSNTSLEDVCLQPKTNLASTLALLLAQPGPDVAESAMSNLVAVAPNLSNQSLADIIKPDPALIAVHMLTTIGDQPENRKSRAYQAFQAFTAIAEGKSGQTKSFSKASKTTIEFFDIHILGIMTHFTDVLENTPFTGTYPIVEKIRCLRAIAEMIHIIKRHISTALPQIRATLQSSMEQEGLCEAAFSAWLGLLDVLESSDIAHVVDQTFALVLKHWTTLSPGLQQTVYAKISELVKNHNEVIKENIMTLPSLSSIPVLSKVGGEIDRLKSHESAEHHCKAFAMRLQDENKIVVMQALKELLPFLERHEEFLHDSAVSEQPSPVLSELLRTLLDATTRLSADSVDAADLCGKALGIIGCLDPNRVEATRKKRTTLVLSNFDNASEVIDWTVILLEDILVQAFKSVANAREQGFLAYVIQEMLRFCGFDDESVLRPRASQAPSVYQKWMRMPEHVRITLTPLVNSRYSLTGNNPPSAPNRIYPGFSPDSNHSAWLRSLVYDLLWRAKGENPQMVFPLLARTVRGHDLSIANFLLPYAMLNIVLGGTVAEVKGISDELLAVLKSQPIEPSQQENVKLCSESVFNVLDYMATWLQEKRKALADSRASAYRPGQSSEDFDEAKDMAHIASVERFLASIPAEVIATQAVMCGSYARALFHWEQYIRQERPLIPSARPPQQMSDDEMLYDRLQDIYAQIDEPDGLEGIAAQLTFLNGDQQAMQHEKAGRWTAAQAWYELQLTESPHNVNVQDRLLSCLRETGRYEPLLRYADSFLRLDDQTADAQRAAARLLPTVVEAYWTIGDLEGMRARLTSQTSNTSGDFNLGVASILSSLHNKDKQAVTDQIDSLRRAVTQSMTLSRASSVQASHDDLRKLHVLHELTVLGDGNVSKLHDMNALLERRISVVGSYVSDKQYILGVRRAVMRSVEGVFDDLAIASSWLMSAKLARQSGNTDSAYSSVLKAYEFGDKGAKLEEARLLWRDAHQRHAIQSLESAISSGIFEMAENYIRTDESNRSSENGNKSNMLVAKAHLLRAKWLDASGKMQVQDMIEKYQYAAKCAQKWEKSHYYLAKHYQKLLDVEKALPKEKRSPQLASGAMTRLVVENLLRSIPFGNKYLHQTVPKLLTLWLDLGAETVSKAPGEDRTLFEARMKALQSCNKVLGKYFSRVKPYVFYAAIPQMISRISHPNPEIWKMLNTILVTIGARYPSEALWSLLALTKATDTTRRERGIEIINRLRDPKQKHSTDEPGVNLPALIAQAHRLSDGLLHACEASVEKTKSSASLSRDLGFNLRLAPNKLVVPIEMNLTATLPSDGNRESIARHKPFVQEKITIASFSDDVLVLSSLQRPRKLTVRGSDGKQYGLLCKPKDDLRKDQRLMEFNGIINRALKRDAESSKRRLYIKTYAVTPLSEESGIIEWVEGIKPMRDILLAIFLRKGVRPSYPELKAILEEACSAPENAHIFNERVLSKFPASLHEWFTEIYPEPETWFAARLRYARSAAVMSMTGHVLGLGDRHGENILLEQSTGGVFHVDFNCLFDKGLTFEKPELVPFRLTHNMVDAMGPYGYEGPFRKSSELTLRLLRQSKDTLMTILETFLYDPTTDFVGTKKKKSHTGVAPETPQEILESVDGKLKGLLKGESVPLSVEGYVDALIKEATNPFNLASMYIGWCAFL